MKKELLDNFSEEEKLILRRRAQKAAKKTEVEVVKKDREFLICRLSGEYYGFETKYMKEVFPISRITPLPSTPEWVLGIINARGEIISVVDLRHFFDLKIEETEIKPKALIIESNDMVFGILIEDVFNVIYLNEKMLTTDFMTFDKIRKEYLLGLTEENYIILDAEKILKDPKMIIGGK